MAAVFALLLTAALGVESRYCRICSTHTMCLYRGVSSACSGGVLFRGVGPEEAASIVDLHNQLRARVALGRERRGSQPPAADMRKMVWDKELAVMAQRWVDQCTFAHDLCRDLERFPVGQNLYIKYSKQAPRLPNWEGPISSWYDEVSYFDPANLLRFMTLGASGHYSQLVSSSSWLMGCGQLTWLEGQTVTYLYVCNYGPAGNMLGRPVYTIGRPCSRCPPGHICSNGLCESLFHYRTLEDNSDLDHYVPVLKRFHL